MRFIRIAYYRKGETDSFCYNSLPDVIPRKGERVAFEFKATEIYKIIDIIYEFHDREIRVIVK